MGEPVQRASAAALAVVGRGDYKRSAPDCR
jgi:hypothetical protein